MFILNHGVTPSQRLNFKTSGLHDYRWTRNMVKKYSISYLVNHWNFSSHNINPLHTLMTKVKVRHFTASTDNLAQRLSIHTHTHTHTHTFFLLFIKQFNYNCKGFTQRNYPTPAKPEKKTQIVQPS